MSGEIRIAGTFRPFGAEQVVVRQVALGMVPIVVIEPEIDEEDDSVTFNIDATGVEPGELADLFEALASGLRQEED